MRMIRNIKFFEVAVYKTSFHLTFTLLPWSKRNIILTVTAQRSQFLSSLAIIFPWWQCTVKEALKIWATEISIQTIIEIKKWRFSMGMMFKGSRWNDKQCRPWSDCSSWSSLIRVFTVLSGLYLLVSGVQHFKQYAKHSKREIFWGYFKVKKI